MKLLGWTTVLLALGWCHAQYYHSSSYEEPSYEPSYDSKPSVIVIKDHNMNNDHENEMMMTMMIATLLTAGLVQQTFL